jgi:hypothetical protein
LRRIKSPPPAIFLPTHKKPVALAELKSSPDPRNGAMAILPAYCSTKWLTRRGGDIRRIPMEHRRSKHMAWLYRIFGRRQKSTLFKNFPPLDPKLLRLHVSAATHGEGGLR